MGLFDKFKIGLGKSSDELSLGFKNIFSKKKIDEKVLSEFEELIISTIQSKDILSEKDINSNKDLQNFQFINSLYDALELIKNKKYDGPKVIFGSHYIAKHVYNYFDFSFDKGNI